MPAQPFRQQRRLIKPALALFGRMQRNGDNRIETAFAKTFVVERGHQPARDEMAKMNLASVFKIARRELITLPWLGKNLLVGIVPLAVACLTWLVMRGWLKYVDARHT